jgi:class 3 adenylate cyclase
MFTSFDIIMERNGCERIKTIGDAYFAVCGVPEKNPDHADNILKSAIEIKEYLKIRNKNSRQKWEIRIGIHTGDVIGGVVGIKKYVFDVFGDTVNTAARMEHHSEPGLINVSKTTHNILKYKYKFIERKPLEVKGKGLMKMYFLDEF